MRILHVLTTVAGGGGAHASALARFAAAEGHEVAFAAPEPVLEEMPHLPGNWRARLDLPWKGVDIVHCHGVRAVLARPPACGRRLIVTPHGLHAVARTQGMRHSIAAALTRKALMRADRIICVGSSEAFRVQDLAPELGRKCVIVPNGVPSVDLPDPDVRAAVRRRLEVAADAPVLLFAGGLRHQKHPELALAAVSEARRTLPNLILLVAGDGPLLAGLRARPVPGVRFLGHRRDVDDLLVASDAVLNTSRWEGLSMSLLEALWRARPILATDAPGNADACGDAGFIVPQERAAVASAIIRLFTESGLLADLSNRARTRAETNFSEAEMCRRTLNVYLDLAIGKVSKRGARAVGSV